MNELNQQQEALERIFWPEVCVNPYLLPQYPQEKQL